MNLGKDVVVDINNGVASISALEGKVKLEVQVGVILAPALEKFKADIESGKIDPVKGTDMDKLALLQAVEYIKKELS